MNSEAKLKLWILFSPVLFLVWSTVGLAKPETGACLDLGALAWDDWTKADAGGSGMPAKEPLRDYVRCKSCHGWDRLGMDGGYVRRTRTAERPNAGLGDNDITSRNIAPGLGNFYHVTTDEVLHGGIGRSFEDGSGSWVVLDADSTVADKTAHSAGFTLGNQHPDFSATGTNADDIVLTQDQVDCLVDFINFGDADPKFYFMDIDTSHDPVRYTINSGASSPAGQTFYEENCFSCHGNPAEDYNGDNGGHPAGGMLAYLKGDGKFSEFVHKARWGIPDTIMTRLAIGTPDSQDMIDVMLYLQELLQSEFHFTSGISGTWYDPDRDGEGFMIDAEEEGLVVVSFYTYDTQGRQFWMIGDGVVDGDQVEIEFITTDGGIYGSGFDPLAVNRYPWGTGTFTFSGCYTGTADIVPNEDFADEFEPLSIEINRLTVPTNCWGD
jgi:hypothetical protein